MPHLRLGLAVAAALLAAVAAAVAAPPASAAVVPPPSLAGETFVAGLNSTAEGETLFSVNETCSSGGTFTFDASGVAAGPYPGTFVEHGSGQVDAAVPGDPGPVVAFHAEFWIMNDVGATIVHGTKDLVGTLSTGSCFSAPYTFDVVFDATTSYDATISTGGGSFRDTGLAHAAGEGANTFGFLAAPPEGEFDTFTETFDTSNGVVPVSGTGKVTGGGWILSPSLTGRVTFGFEAQSTPSGGLHATCEVVDHATKTKIHCTDADSLVVSGTHATFHGTATIDGVRTQYTIDVDDLGEPGTLDTFKIVTSSGYAAGGTLMGGNIQIHTS